jgi:hypothetical protein
LLRRLIFSSHAALVCAALALTVPGWSAVAVGNTVFTFEGVADEAEVGTFYPGVTFFNTHALVAGGHFLDAATFPPASGDTVAADDDDPMDMLLDLPVHDFLARFTHSDIVTLVFELNGTIVGSVDSVFKNNLAIGGDPGTTPNEGISFHSTGGFNEVFVDGGGEMVMDDVTFAAPASAPEPGTVMLFVAGFALVAIGYRKSRLARP